MFKNQGLFSSIPCPSTTCTSTHCPYSHSNQTPSTSPPEASVEVRGSSPNIRSTKRRRIERSPSSSPLKVAQNDQTSQNTFPSSSHDVKDSAKMLDVLPRTPQQLPQREALMKRPLVEVGHNPSRQSDVKRKYTETFNLAAKEFIPAGEQKDKPSPPQNATLIADSSVHPSINFNVRQVPLNMIYKTYKDLYVQLPDGATLAARDAALEEAHVANTSPNARAYQVAWKQVYARLKKRDPITSVKKAGTLYGLEARRLERKRLLRWNASLTPAELAPLIPSREELTRWGYTTRHPVLQPFNPNEMAACHRCTTMFTRNTRTQYPCISHWGKLLSSSPASSSGRPNSSDGKVWSCCQNPVGSRGCTTHPCHVRKVDNLGQLAAIRPFTCLDPFIEGQHVPIVSLDCEMAYTVNGMELIRVTVLDDNDQLVFDLLVRPEGEIYDFNTRFSGITREIFENKVTVSFDEALEMLKHFVSSETIIIGHGLENDLLALRLLHFAVVDTALVFPHPRGRPYRLGLKDLMKRETGLDIQTAGEEGHSSVEDAGAASLLVRKAIRGDAFPGFGNVQLGPIVEAQDDSDGGTL